MKAVAITIRPVPTVWSDHEEMLEVIRINGSEILKRPKAFLRAIEIQRELKFN